MQMELLLIDIWQENIEQWRGAQKNFLMYMEMAQSFMEVVSSIIFSAVVLI